MWRNWLAQYPDKVEAEGSSPFMSTFRFLISLYIYRSKILIHSMQLTYTYNSLINLNLGEGRDMDTESGA